MEVLSSATKHRQEMKCKLYFLKEEIKLFRDDIIVSIQNPKESKKKTTRTNM